MASVAADQVNLPFAVDRAAGTELSVQVARGLRAAIHNGFYAPGEQLPGVRQMARALATSNVVILRAVRELVEDGLLASRPGSGIRVLREDERSWRGHVLWVGGTLQAYYFAAVEETVAAGLAAANLRLTAITYVDALPDVGAAMLRACLQTMGITLVVNTLAIPELPELCRHYGIPLVDCADHAAGNLWRDDRSALRELAAHVQRLGGPEVMVLALLDNQFASVRQALAERGLTVRRAPVTWVDGHSRQEANERTGFASTHALLAAGPPPELLYVADDYVARGCLTALLEAGLRIPEDIQTVFHANRGNNLAWHQPFTRIENDPAEVGRAIVKLIRAANNGTPVSPAERIGPRFIVGASTRPVPAPAELQLTTA